VNTARLTRATEIVLVVNAMMATIAAAAFALELAPFSAAQPEMARRAAAGEFAGALIMLLIAMRLRRDESLIAVPIAFVLCQLIASGYELFKHRTSAALLPFAFEAAALIYYAVYAAIVLRSRRAQRLARRL
jgi:hypothetical protein